MKIREILVRQTRERDFPQIIDVCKKVYPNTGSWTHRQLSSHLQVFPDGQFVAVHEPAARVVGMAASLIVAWDDYDALDSWRDFTDAGMFTNHDPENGRTLYGAEVMVDPSYQGMSIGSRLYRARAALVRKLGLKRIRAGARLRGYHRFADRMDARAYVRKVIRGEIWDPTLSFQLKHGFRVLSIVSDYLGKDPESLGFAALIEWLNPEQGEQKGRQTKFDRHCAVER